MNTETSILNDAELDQVSGGDNPYGPPVHPPHYHGPVRWHHEPSVSAITPFRNLDFYLGD